MLCPGRRLPFLLCSPEAQTPARLRSSWCPTRYSQLAQNPSVQHRQVELFVKLSAYFKNWNPTLKDNLEKLLRTLKVSDSDSTPSLSEEVDEASDEVKVKAALKGILGDSQLMLADCHLLSKCHMV
ncbi:Chloride intracellular channel protein 1 [Microtus ochrogaster]|uniref:Chloride intracellular channel protein 1 n=1 Tax=Microtus ochrogaster TaxID=79684 RepID=A0A8J6KV08_MICOH|nr:Chloride intracellular channel protein 1 [Microtus ochrogaster]